MEQIRNKLNRLQRLVPDGLLADAAWLTAMDYPSPLRSRYLERGWLERVARGLFRRPARRPGLEHVATPLHWQHVVVSLQMVMGSKQAVGGRTALELEGYGHYLPTGGAAREVHLYGDEPPPNWLRNLRLASPFVLHKAAALFPDEPVAKAMKACMAALAEGRGTDLDAAHGSFVWRQLGDSDWGCLMSTPERAAFELLDEVPLRETFGQADELMEGLVDLNPRRVRRLLLGCRSVKVKRLFLWFAERHAHAWFKRVDVEGVNLGKGKRQLALQGKLEPKYLITVPVGMDG